MENKPVYTKEDILKYLSGKGYFIDNFTLTTFFKKWNIEPIYKDEKDVEFFEKDITNTILKNLFNKQQNEQGADMENYNSQNTNTENNKPDIIENTQPYDEHKDEAIELLKGISLSDGTNLMDKIETTSIVEITEKGQQEIEKRQEELEAQKEEENKRPGLLESAMQSAGMDFNSTQTTKEDDEDDLNALSNSFRELEMKEFEINNAKELEKKLDISSEIKVIAKVMAKKIAKYVSAICMQEAKSSMKLSEAQEEILKLNQKIRSYEEQNRKLRLLLTESNRNLNSYKPSIFGLYKKEKPNK